MKGFTKLGRTLLVLTVLFILPLSDVMSQKFIMETGTATYNATCGGVIKMKTVAASPNQAEFVNTAGDNDLGEATYPIEGIVEWAGAADGQQVQGLYYEKMMISGGFTKTILDGVNIVGEACDITDLLPGYSDFATYPFFITPGQLNVSNDFQGTLTYSGVGTLVDPVNIFPVTGDDDYQNLVMNGPSGFYALPDGTTTTVNGTISLPATNELAVNGDLFTSDVPANPSILEGVVNIANGGTINLQEADLTFNGNVTVADGSIIADATDDGTVTVGPASTLELSALTGILNFGDGTNLVITGDLTNSFLGSTGANLLFSCGSTVTYDGAAGQLILPTPDVAGNRYGNLVLTTDDKVGGTATYGNNINVCNDFSLAGGDLDMRTNDGYIQMNAATGLVTYGGGTGTEEVLGAFRRKLAASGDVALATAYTFNNYKTQVSFTALPTADPDAYYQLDIDRDQAPINYIPGTDIDRKVVVSYDLAGAFEYTLQAGYLTGETPTFTSPLTEDNLKFFEADGSTVDDVEKVAGTGYGRNTTDPIKHLSLSGLIGGNTAVDGTIERFITSGNDLVLRANNTMYSIVDGRWTNPNVWDEGRAPRDDDNVEVRTMVYVGINGPFAGTPGEPFDADNEVATLNTKSEAAEYDNSPGKSAAANTIVIGNFTNASLIIGNEDNGASYKHTTLFAGTSFTNNNINASSAAFPMAAKGTFTNSTGFNGLWLNGYGANTPVLQTRQLQNSGSINNEGIIEVGQ